MSYKKYIVRNGKTYGPYTYNSRRVNGKVVSEYEGRGVKIPSFHLKSDFDFSKTGKYFVFAFVFAFLFVGGIFIYFFGFRTGGQAVLELDTNYVKGEVLQGLMKINLQQGELLPAGTKIVVANNNQTYEFNVEDFISQEKVNGDYYFEGKDLSGGGDGYGLPGVKESNPEIDFTFIVTSGEVETPVTEVPIEENPIETPTENETVVEEVPVEEVPVVEETPAEATKVEKEIAKEAVKEEKNNEESPTENEEVVEETPVTGNVITRFFGRVANFFLAVNPTGRVTLGLEREVSGSVYGNENYTYELAEGETAVLKQGSVSLNGEIVDDSYVNFDVDSGVVTVTTDYSENENGFGADYLGDYFLDLEINLSELAIVPEEGDFVVNLVYGSEELISVTSSIDSANPNQKVSNRTKADEEVEQTISESYDLTEIELAKLKLEFGENFTINTTQAEIKNNRLVVKNVLGRYWILNSYDSIDGNVDAEILEKIALDKKKWLKILAQALIAKETSDENVEISELLGEAGINDIIAVSPSEVNVTVVEETPTGNETAVVTEEVIVEQENNVSVEENVTAEEIVPTENASVSEENATA